MFFDNFDEVESNINRNNFFYKSFALEVFL